MLSEPFPMDPVAQFLCLLCDSENIQFPPQEREDSQRTKSPTIVNFLSAGIRRPNSSLSFVIPRGVPQVSLEQPRSRKSRQKALDRISHRSTSYRKLREQHNLETDAASHFLLNHKYKIVQFGCPGSVTSRPSDDEGNVKRFGNPLYNQDILNLRFDDIADYDILTQIDMAGFLKSGIENEGRRSGTIDGRHRFLVSFRDNTFTAFSLPVPFEIEFVPTPRGVMVHTRDFYVISAILSNMEMWSKSLRIGRVIFEFFKAYRMLVRKALGFPRHRSHIVCDARGLTCLNVTHQLLAAVAQSLGLPENWKFRVFCDLLDRFGYFTKSILDELTVALAEQIDTGGPFARELLQYRELLCAAEFSEFCPQIRQAADALALKNAESKLIEIAASRFAASSLYEVRFVFTSTSQFSLEIREMDGPRPPIPVFPMITMFTAGQGKIVRHERDRPSFMPW
jgi:hypothetical protein